MRIRLSVVGCRLSAVGVRGLRIRLSAVGVRLSVGHWKCHRQLNSPFGEGIEDAAVDRVNWKVKIMKEVKEEVSKYYGS